MDRAIRTSRGPFRAYQINDGDTYELSNGHAVYCSPAGAIPAKANLLGGAVLGTDPDVESAGVDAGFSPEPGTMRAPDVAVGGLPDAPGWAPGVPPLAVEYAGTGQDEPELQRKISELLGAGTRHIWVVRLVGPRRVEVYEPARPMRTVNPGEYLEAPGILRNAVLVESLYDQEAANEAVLRNLLQRHGYESLDEVRREGLAEGKAEGILDLLAARGVTVDGATRARILACTDADLLRTWLVRSATATALHEVFAGS